MHSPVSFRTHWKMSRKALQPWTLKRERWEAVEQAGEDFVVMEACILLEVLVFFSSSYVVHKYISLKYGRASSVLLKGFVWSGEMAQLVVKYLLQKHEDPCLVPRIHIQNPGSACTDRRRIPGHTGQSAMLHPFVGSRSVGESEKTRRMIPEEHHPTLGFHMYTCMHAHVQTHTHSVYAFLSTQIFFSIQMNSQMSTPQKHRYSQAGGGAQW